MFAILLELRPQSLVGGSNLTGDVAGHLRGELVQETDVTIRPLLDALTIRCLPMREGILTCVIERIPVGQLGLSESLALLRSRQQFQFGGDDLLHGFLMVEL